MRADQAPAPGWYPDPTGGTQLWWWDGLDWTAHRRTSPPEDHGWIEAAAGAAADAATGAGADASPATRQQVRERATATRSRERTREQDTAEAVAHAKRAARAEVNKAVKEATAQLQDARTKFLPRLQEYRRKFRRWSRWGIVVAFAIAMLWLWVQATFSVGLLEWVGDRIDAVTSVVWVDVTDPTAQWPLRTP